MLRCSNSACYDERDHQHTQGGAMSHTDPRSRLYAFTLVEVLVVIGIIAVLMALFVPMLARAQQQAHLVHCASNMRQICTGLIAFSAENHGKFPSNTISPAPGRQWWDWERIGRFI